MRNICTVGEFNDMIFYRAICDCTSEICDLELLLYKEEDIEELFLNISGQFYYDVNLRKGYSWISRRWKWLKSVIKLIFTGRIEVRHEFLLKGQQIDDFITALKEGKKKLMPFKGKKNKNGQK